ncbi:ThiF family adenylyltransferase [Variovorax sp. DT-64]|uniref:ThiF family adenylyltransferase n=1 Tax=Variovorax sp. DT-64 TaxID=3396160 RepID=UPI003F1D8847
MAALRSHSQVRKVHPPTQIESFTFVAAEISVNLPSRAAGGVSATGVRAAEELVFRFPATYPMEGPVLFLRQDFPTALPHINPHKAGSMVPPCVYQGSLNDLLHAAGFEAVVDQAVSWLERAASGQLMALQQGWEPTRRGDSKILFNFDADAMVAALPRDGAPALIPSRYVQIGDDILLTLAQGKTEPTLFSQGERTTRRGKPLLHGGTPVLVAMAPWEGDHARIFDTYQPDTVYDLDTLSQRAHELGIDAKALREQLDSICSRSNLVATSVEQWPWPGDFVVGIVLAVRRPVHLIGSSREIEFIPYLMRLPRTAAKPDIAQAQLVPAYHVHRLSPKLLARTSGYEQADLAQRVAILGCGSLGSKIALHLGRAGFGQLTLVDNESLMPHNLARHAAVDTDPPDKALNLGVVIANLGHAQVKAESTDIIPLLEDEAKLLQVADSSTRLIVDTTASAQIAAAATHSGPLATVSGRFARSMMYNRGAVAAVLLEGPSRHPRCDDLLAQLFRWCRLEPALRAAIKGDASDLAEVFVGDNCRSITMPMADSAISRGAATVSVQIERWLLGGLPAHGVLAVGLEGADGIGMSWHPLPVDPATELFARGDGGWNVRVGANVVEAVTRDAARYNPLETGGALLGHIDYFGRTIVIAEVIDAPLDSIRERNRFVLGTQGLQQLLHQASDDTLGYLHYIGTWHSHPMGGGHSTMDRDTLGAIADFAPGLPIVSLVWKPDGFICEVARH